MRYLFLLTLLLFSTLHANKVLYLSHTEIPNRVIKGEVFSITIKTISTIKDFSNINYEFNNRRGLKVLNSIPYREQKGKYFLETFQFIATRNAARLPDITATLESNDTYESTTLLGKKLNVISLNPKEDFSNVIANSLELSEYKTTSYDTKHNIIVFTVLAQNSNLSTIKFQNVFKQGLESFKESYVDPKVTYFVVINKELEKFSFSYFNLLNNQFNKITIPIVVDDDSVTTQTDLKPKDQSKEQLKMNIAIAIAIIIFILAIWKKHYFYIILIIFPIIYILYFAMPSQDICIRKGSMIYLLPVQNGTIFETTEIQYYLPKEGEVENFTKVKLQNERIGWVKNEDICSH